MSEDAKNVQRVPQGIPALYADHVMDCIYGFYTTKLVFGVETGAPKDSASDPIARPVAVVTIPTPMLLAAALQMVSDLSRAQLVEDTSQRYATVLEQMRALGQLLPPVDGTMKPRPEPASN